MSHYFKRRRQAKSTHSGGPTYAPLRPSTEEEEYDQRIPGESRRFIFWSSLLGILVLSAVGYSFFAVSTSSLEPYAYERYDARTARCGSTAKEAKSLGCQFDPITFSWLPMDCLDVELIEEFRALNWTLYGDRNKTTTATEDEWLSRVRGGQKAWLTNKDRDIRCIYSWKWMHRAVVAGRSLPAGLSDYGNTLLCAEALNARRPLNEVALGVTEQFPAC